MEMMQEMEYTEQKQDGTEGDYPTEQAEVPVVVEEHDPDQQQQQYQTDAEFVGEIEPEPVLEDQEAVGDPQQLQGEKEDPSQNMEEAAQGENIDPIDLDELQKIQSKMPPADPEAPVGSSKNPIRIVQQGNQYITTQDVSEDHLQQIIQVLTNQALLHKSQAKPSAIYNRNTNKRIIFRVTRGKRRKPEPEKDPELEDVKPMKQELFDNPFKKENDEELDEEEEDPDFEPELPEEEILPFPLMRRKASSGRQVKPPKHLVKDYKHLKIEELNAEESSDENNSDVGYADYSGAENSQDDENREKEFVCEICQLGFDTKAGLARHKGVKHGGDYSFQKNRWSNPYMASVRRRNKLQEAVAAATDDDLIEFVAPRLAKILSPWDHLLMRSEQGDPPLPHVPGLVFEYLSLADQARAFLAEHLSAKEKNKDPKKGEVNEFNKENEGDQNDVDENPDQVIVRIDNSEESGALGLPIGRYVVESPLKEEFLPRRFRSVLASQRIAQARKEEEARLRGRFEFDRGQNMYDPKRPQEDGAGDESKQEGYYETVHDPGFGDDLLLMTEGGLGFPVPEAWLQSGAYLAVLTETGLQSDLVMEASSGKLYHKPTGQLVSLGGVTSLGEAQEEGETQEQAMMEVDMQEGAEEVVDSQMATQGDSQIPEQSLTQEEQKQEATEITEGEPITQVLDEESQQYVEIESAFPGVTVTEISHEVCMIAKSNGTQFQVEHGGTGITLATLQDVLALDDQD